jgi:hypothetical protein
MKEEHPLDSIRKVLDAIRQETVPMDGHSDPGAIIDCWRSVDDYLSEIEKECSHLAANQCETPAGDEHGHFYCVRLRDALVQMKLHRGENVMLKSQLKQREDDAYVEGYKDGKSVSVEYDNEIKQLKEALGELINMVEPEPTQYPLIRSIDKAKGLL